MAAEPTAHHRDFAAFVSEHRGVLEAYVDRDKKTARAAEGLLIWEREYSRAQEAGQ